MLFQGYCLGKKQVALVTLDIFNTNTRNLLYCVRIRFFFNPNVFFWHVFSLNFLLVLNYIATLVTLQTFSTFFVTMLYQTHLSYTLISILCTLFSIFHYYLLECVMVWTIHFSFFLQIFLQAFCPIFLRDLFLFIEC